MAGRRRHILLLIHALLVAEESDLAPLQLIIGLGQVLAFLLEGASRRMLPRGPELAHRAESAALRLASEGWKVAAAPEALRVHARVRGHHRILLVVLLRLIEAVVGRLVVDTLW